MNPQTRTPHARTVFDTGRTRPAAWRIAQLRAIERMCDEQEQAIAAALLSDLGRPAMEAWMGDVQPTKAEAAFARKRIRKWMRRRRVSVPVSQQPARAWIQYDPKGAVLVIGPWNYPFYLAMAPVVSAVAAGNTVVIKPSELAPPPRR